MNEVTYPLQSTKTLIIASITAVIIATTLYFTIILPAEFNQDPTGIGKILGLTQLSEESVQAANEVAVKPNSIQKDEVTVIVPANKGVEYKFHMKQLGKIKYQWQSNTTPLYFDFHGEPKGDTTGFYESYSIATVSETNGTITVPFDGVHGWYWKNTSDQDVSVTLKTEGEYEVIGLIK